MVARQLTPELTQPSVLVEIDHGPSVGLHHEIQRRVPGIPQAQVSKYTAPVATSPWRRAEPAPMACDVGPGPGVGQCDTACTSKDDAEGRNEVPEYESVELSEESVRSRRNLGSHDAIRPTSTELGIIAVGHGVNRWEVCEKHQQDAPLVSMSVRSGHEDTRPEGTLAPWTLFETAQRVVPPLPDHAKGYAELLSITRSPSDDSPADFSGLAGDTKYRTTRWDRHEAVNSDGNKNVKFVITGKKRTAGEAPFGHEKLQNTSRHDLPMRAIHFGGSKEPRSTGHEDAEEVEPPLSMSSAGSSLERSTADPECIALATFMWMTAYNLVSYSSPLTFGMGLADLEGR